MKNIEDMSNPYLDARENALRFMAGTGTATGGIPKKNEWYEPFPELAAKEIPIMDQTLLERALKAEAELAAAKQLIPLLQAANQMPMPISTHQRVLNAVQYEAQGALWSVAARQVAKTAKGSLIAAFEKGASSTPLLAIIVAALRSPIGDGITAFLIGVTLPFVAPSGPMLPSNTMENLAHALRDVGMTDAGGAVADVVFEPMRDAIANAIALVPLPSPMECPRLNGASVE